jgi:transmembrane sensor
MEYHQFSVEELASDESFIAWALDSDPEARRFWDKFIELHPEMRVKVVQARTLVINLRRVQERPVPDDQIEEIWSMIDSRTQTISTEVRQPSPAFRYYAMAAMLTAAVMAAFVLYVFNRTDDIDENGNVAATTVQSDFVEEVNTSGNALRLHLSDGTIVELENDSRLKYKKDYRGDEMRVVHLTGEAFFEVARNPGQPFIVRANDVVTRVLGTSFRVKAPEGNEQVVVSVKSGRVSVYTAAGDEHEAQKNAVIVLPNEQVTYQRDQETFGKSLVNEPQVVGEMVNANDFVFENTPIKDVFAVLEKAYEVDIIYDEELMSNCFFTAPLGSEHLFEKLKIICRAIGARYETIDARVVITSTGCNP